MTPSTIPLTLTNPEVFPVDKKNRRTAADKLRIIREANACAHGQLGSHGVYRNLPPTVQSGASLRHNPLKQSEEGSLPRRIEWKFTGG